ncbi:Rgg/GadR/MutR family transcriptional regulator [Lactobacillus sp. PV034]|nr:Rgg/GadR/MutR family transcriptional regulator [Lactobacillus sp. PV034]QNQ81169.1 Rgg/GadR/MutR family transcriptional regulator [Lactobacillus sp. PV034]
MKETTEKPDKQLRDKVKEKIFSIPNFNENKVALFCNFMPFYDLESNKIIAKKIINQYILSNNIKMQIALSAIIVNVLAVSLDENNEKDVNYFITNAKKIKIRPELVFYKLALSFFENMINYRTTKNTKFFNKSKEVVNILISIDMSQYGATLQRLLLKYK